MTTALSGVPTIFPESIGRQVDENVSPEAPTTTSEMVPPAQVTMEVTELGKWIHAQVDHILTNRRAIEIDWIKCRHILNGHHRLATDLMMGYVVPEEEDDEIHAHTNLMLNRYRRELGRRLSAPIKINATPRLLEHPTAFQRARVTRLALQHWMETSRFQSTFDQFNQTILRMDMAAFLVEQNDLGTSARVSIISAADLFPLPALSTGLEDAEGLNYRKFLSETTLKQLVEQGKLKADVLSQITKTSTADSVGSPFLSLGGNLASRDIKGAIANFFYFFPSAKWPRGMHGMSIGTKIYAINTIDGEPSLPIGGPPIPVWDQKTDSDFYGDSFCSALVSLNLEDNRQLSNEIAISEVNRHAGWTFVPEDVMSTNDFQSRLGGFIPYKTQQFGVNQRDPFFQVRPPQIGPESSLVSRRIANEADETASQSGVNRGEGPGRVDSDQAINRLLAQTEMPNEPFFQRTRVALEVMLERVLDILSVTWDEATWVSVVGPFDLPQSVQIGAGELPNSLEMRVQVSQLVPTSRIATLQILNMLRASKDIGPGDYKRALIANGLEPLGVELTDPEEQFAVSKVLWVYNDGKEPRQYIEGPDFQLEPHKAIVKQIRRFVNRLDYKIQTSEEVKTELQRVLLTHQQVLAGQLGRLRAQVAFENEDIDRFDREVGRDEDLLGGDNPLTSQDISALGV